MNAEGMTTNRPAGRTPHDSSLVRAGVLVLGIAVAMLLLAQGLVVHGPVLSGVSLAVFAVFLMLVLLTASVPGASAGRRTLDNVLVPVAAGLIAVTLVVGTVRFPGAVAWWLPATVLSAAPIIAIAALRPATSRPAGRRAR